MTTVGKLLRDLKECPDDWVIYFSEKKKANFVLLQIDITYNSIWSYGKAQDSYNMDDEHVRIHMEAKAPDEKSGDW